jgi:hypothetical protein
MRLEYRQSAESVLDAKGGVTPGVVRSFGIEAVASLEWPEWA